MKYAALIAIMLASPAAGQSLLGSWDCDIRSDGVEDSRMQITYGRTGAFLADIDLHIESRRFGTADILATVRGRYAATDHPGGSVDVTETAQSVRIAEAFFWGREVREGDQLSLFETEIRDIFDRASIVFGDDRSFVRFGTGMLDGVCSRTE